MKKVIDASLRPALLGNAAELRLQLPHLSASELASITLFSLLPTAVPAALAIAPSRSAVALWPPALPVLLRTAALFLFIRLCTRLRKQRLVLQGEEDAAVEGSFFAQLHNVSVHYTLLQSTAAADAADYAEADAAVESTKTSAVPDSRLVFHFNHGFGANALTWDWLYAPLLKAVGEQREVSLIAHDRVGFGLTSRPFALGCYSREFNARLALGLLESTKLSAAPVVLAGHSLGATITTRMLTMLASANRQHNVKALVLIAPAILARSKKSADPVSNVAESDEAASAAVADPDGSPARASPPPIKHTRQRAPTLLQAARTFGACIAAVLQIWNRIAASISRLVWLSLRLPLRIAIHSPTFWRLGLRNAFADPTKLTAEMIMRYRWPAQVRGADRGILSFVRAELFRSSSISPTDADADAARTDIWQQLRELQIPVLIIHGQQDRLVPAFNSRRLAAANPWLSLVEIDNCGHCPQEEQPEVVATAVRKFLLEKKVI